MKALLDAGVDFKIRDGTGKTAQEWAIERGWGNLYDKMVQGIHESDTPYGILWTDRILTLITVMSYPLTIFILSRMAVYYSLPLVLILLYILQKYVIVGYLFAENFNMVHKSSLTNGILWVTLMYVAIGWLRVVVYTSFRWATHLLFVVSIIVCSWSLYSYYFKVIDIRLRGRSWLFA